jgi:tyrosine-protein kinase Etk/Wzc
MLEEANHTNSSENIDFNKLGVIIRNNLVWIILTLVITNAVAFLYVRYTKELYESVSEIKLDVKQDASELGMQQFAPDKNINLISGEIETIQSKLFLNRVIDSLDLSLSYYSIGQLLNYELYKSSPFTVNFSTFNPALYNISFHVTEKSPMEFELQVGEGGEAVTGSFNEPISIEGCELILTLKSGKEFQRGIHYSFVLNSRDVLMDGLQKNLTVEPLNFDAKTIKVSFKDNNPFKARDLVNGIDSLYLQYSNDQKNLANKQKIDWLAKELLQIETKMG